MGLRMSLLAQWATAVLYQPRIADAAYIGGALVVLLLCAVCATFVPASRAAGASPSEALK